MEEHICIGGAMSNDLVKRLRETSDDWPAALLELELEAADLIEKLEAALRLYACESTCPNCYGQVQDTRYCGWTARTALEGKDD